MSEPLFSCTLCGRGNFTRSGLRSHWCDEGKGGKSRAITKQEWQAMVDPPASLAIAPVTREVTFEVLDAMPPVRRAATPGAPMQLEEIADHIRQIDARIQETTRGFQNEVIYDIVGKGLLLLKAEAVYLVSDLPETVSGRRHERNEKGQLAAQEGFTKWLGDTFPELNERTARNYRNAARNAGLTSDHTLDDVQALKTALVLHEKKPTDLYKLADALKTPEKQDPAPAPNLVADLMHDLFAALDQALQLRGQFDDQPFEAVTTRLRDTLQRWTGTGWIMGQEDGSAQHGDVDRAITIKAKKGAKKKPSKRGGVLSPEARAKIVAAQKKRWAKTRGGK